MARLSTTGFEINDFPTSGTTAEGWVKTANGSISSAVVRSGALSFQTGNGQIATVSLSPALTLTAGRRYFLRAYCQWTTGTLPGLQQTIMGENAGTDYNVKISATGKLGLFHGSTQIGSDSATLVVNRWYRIELSWIIATGTGDAAELELDGVSVASETGANRTDTLASIIQIGAFSAVTSSGFFVDDIALNDDQGASQNSWPGEGKVVLLLPTADSAVGTGWTLGTGTAISSNGFGSVDNTPPVGVTNVEAGSDPKQIRNASSNANSAYDATMTTYTAAGIGAGSTINVVDPIVMTAAPVSTGAKQGTVGLVSNPAITPIALAAGGTSGAFWSGVAENTYPTGWKLSHSTVTYDPAVTLGTAPVMRINQVTSSTRIATVCFMGIYVDYTPAVVTSMAMNERQRPRRSLIRTSL